MSKNIKDYEENNSKEIDRNIQTRNTKKINDIDNFILEKTQFKKTNNIVKNSKRNRIIIIVSMFLLLTINFCILYNVFLDYSTSTNDQPGLEYTIKTSEGEECRVKNFNESEKKFTENLLLDIIDFIEINYDVKFSSNFREEKIKNLKIAYIDIKEEGALALYERSSGYIYVDNESLNSKDLEKIIGDITHEMIHYLSVNGDNIGFVYKCTSQDKIIFKGYAINEAVTEKICIDYLMFKYRENKKESYVYTPSAYYNCGLVDMARALDLLYKKNLYKFFFENDFNSLAKEFNEVTIVKNNCYSGSKGCENFVDDTDYFLNEVCINRSSNLDKLEMNIKLNLKEKLVNFVDKKNQDRINILLT